MFDLPAYLLKPLLEKIAEPFLIILLLIIWWLFRQNSKLMDQVFSYGDTLSKIVTLVEMLVYRGKRDAGDS